MRTIVIGDIHGCYKALVAILAAIRPAKKDCLIFLGDYVDRGPDSFQVIECLLTLKRNCNAVFLIGNHEIMLRHVLDGAPPTLWLEVGGHETVSSYGGTLSGFPATHRTFLDELLPYFETETHIFVHANYLPNLPLEQQPHDVLFWSHLTEHVPGVHLSGKSAFCGHTPQPNGKIGFFGHLICLDTGCCLGGCLTAMHIETGKIWQSDKMGRLSP